MTIDETTTNDVPPLFLNSHHLLLAVVATIAAEHGIQATRELVDNLAEDEATWQDIAQKLGVSAETENAIDTEPPPPPDATATGAESYESAGPDATGPATVETPYVGGDSSILPPPPGETNGHKNAHV